MKNVFIICLFLSLSTLHAEVHNVYKKIFTYQRNDLNKEKTNEHHGQTFMLTRPVYRNIAAQQSLWHDIIIGKPCKLQGAFQALGIYQETLPSDKVGRYFLVNESNNVIIKGDNTPRSDLRDVRAEWLGLPSRYAGVMRLNPRQRQFGAWIEYHQEVKRCICNEFFDNMWVGIAFPIQMVENDLQLSQITTSTEIFTGSVTNIAQSFTRQDLEYARIGGKERRTSVSEVMFKLGVNFPMCEGYEASIHSLFVVPTHGAQNPEYLFDPFLGNNGHWGFGTGISLQLPLNKNVCDYVFAFYFNIENIYFFRKGEYRTLGLKQTEWGQYLLMNTMDGKRNIPAANLLTRRVRVESYNAVDLSGGLRWTSPYFEAELGYNLWARGHEELKLRDKFEPTFGIAGTGDTMIKGVTVGATASKSTIECLADDDLDENMQPTFVPIQLEDIDFCKGAARSALSNRCHIAFGRKFPGCHMDGFIGAGGYIQASNRNSTLKAWGVWAKFGLSA